MRSNGLMKALSIMATMYGIISAEPYYVGNGTVSSTYTTSLKTGTPSLTLTHSVDTNYEPAVIKFQLSLASLDVSAWGTSATSGYGMYMGIGLGKSSMTDVDYIWCRYTFTNRATDALICNDAYADVNSTVSNDTSNDLYNVTSTSPASYVRTSKSAATATFTTAFTRPVRTNDTVYDF